MKSMYNPVTGSSYKMKKNSSNYQKDHDIKGFMNICSKCGRSTRNGQFINGKWTCNHCWKSEAVTIGDLVQQSGRGDK